MIRAQDLNTVAILFVIIGIPALQLLFTGLSLWSDNRWRLTRTAGLLLGLSVGLLVAFATLTALLLSLVGGIMLFMALSGLGGKLKSTASMSR